MTTCSAARRWSRCSTFACSSRSSGRRLRWSAPRRCGPRPAQNPRPRLLVVDEVWSIMQHPEGAAFMVSMAKRARKHRLGLQFITQDVQDLLSEDTSRAITGHFREGAAPERCLQASAPAGRGRRYPRSVTRSTCLANSAAGCCHAREATACCLPAATASRYASRRLPRRRRSSSGGRERTGVRRRSLRRGDRQGARRKS